MGAADIIPGVSGGTIALVTGIYERLIAAINSVDFRFILYFFKGFADKTYFSKTRQTIAKIRVTFLLPILGGIAIAFLLLARLLKILLDSYPAPTYAFFFGLILASSLLVYQYIRRINVQVVVFFLIGFFFAFFFVGLEALSTNHTLLVLFLSGIVTICAMILPGISGAFILLFLGQYHHMLNALNNWWIADIIIYILGGIVGLFTFSRVLELLLTKYRIVTLSFLMGLMIGALRQPSVVILNQPENPALCFVSAVIGVGIVLLFSYYKFYVGKKQGDRHS